MWWWKRRVHSSWCLALVCAGFVAGVVVSLEVRLVFWWGLGAFLFVCLGFAYQKVYSLPVLAVGSFVLGISYGSAHLVERSVYKDMVGHEVNVRGKVREDPSLSDSGSTSLQLTSVEINNTPMPGAIFVSVRSVDDVKRGDWVEGFGETREGFGSFPVSFSLMKLNSVSRSPLGDVGRVVRDWFAEKVRLVVPDPQASLGIGFLTGQKSALPPDLSEALKIAGLTHIVVASGYNLTILVQMARKLLLRVSKFLAAMSAAVMILSFMAITGLSPSMTRAGLVSGMSLMAWYYGHGFHPLVLLPIAAAITVAYQPSYVWGDLGWQLSFSAFAGVMIVAPLLQAYFFGPKEPGVVRQILGETISAHMVTIPAIALSFGVISNVAIIANLLVVPLVPLAMLLTFICGIGAMLSLPFIQIIAAPTSWLLEYMISVARFVAELPWAQSELEAGPLAWVGYAILLGLICLWMWRNTHYNFRASQVDMPP